MARHTLRGQVAQGETKRLIVDDGLLTQGHKVTSFTVWGTTLGSGQTPICILGTKSNMGASMDASDGRQIGWAAQTAVANSLGNFQLLDPDRVVLQDLFIYNQGTATANYLVVIEPVTLTNDQSVLTLIKERNQDDIR